MTKPTKLLFWTYDGSSRHAQTRPKGENFQERQGSGDLLSTSFISSLPPPTVLRLEVSADDGHDTDPSNTPLTETKDGSISQPGMLEP